MFKDNVTPEEIVKLLNEMLKIDYEATKRFVQAKLYTNKIMADHPTIQVDAYTEKGKFKFGVMGFLNGLFGTNEYGFGCIYYTTDDTTGKIIEFGVNRHLGKPKKKKNK